MRYQVSVLQAEFSLTQVFDRPQQGRVFFEEVLRENLDAGDRVQLIFERRVTKRTPGRFRTRVLTTGVDPSLHFEYKQTRVKQYFKEGHALHKETTINDTYDFGVGRKLSNPEDLKAISFTANRCLLRAERLSHDWTVGASHLAEQRAPGAAPARVALRGRAGASAAGGRAGVRLPAGRLPLAPNVGTGRGTAGQDARVVDLLTHDVRPAAAAAARPDRAHRGHAALAPEAAPTAPLSKALEHFDSELQHLWEGHCVGA